MKHLKVMMVVGGMALACNAAGADERRSGKSILDKVRGVPAAVPAAVPTEAAQLQTTAPAAGATAAGTVDLACAKSGATGELSDKEMLLSMVSRKALDSAAKSLRVEEIELPAPIENVCQASKRFSFVQRSTSHWSLTVINSIQQAKEAVGISQQVASYEAFKSNPDFGKASSKDISRLQKDMNNDLETLEKAIAEKRVVNQAMLGEASANMRAALLQGGLIGAWDKRLVEFIGDNSRWAFKEQLSSVKMFGDHLELLGTTLSSMGSVVEAHDAIDTGAKDDKKAAAILKQREKENQAYEKQLLAELQL